MGKPKNAGTQFASDGVYGATPYDPAARDAKALLKAIERELDEQAFFTREDLLHTSAFSHVTTISRYRNVCAAISWLLERRKLLAITRTELCLAGRKRDYRTGESLMQQYRPKIESMATSFSQDGEPVSVLDILDAWGTDTELTRNVKRVLIRKVMAQLVREGILLATDEPGVFLGATEQ